MLAQALLFARFIGDNILSTLTYLISFLRYLDTFYLFISTF